MVRSAMINSAIFQREGEIKCLAEIYLRESNSNREQFKVEYKHQSCWARLPIDHSTFAHQIRFEAIDYSFVAMNCSLAQKVKRFKASLTFRLLELSCRQPFKERHNYRWSLSTSCLRQNIFFSISRITDPTTHLINISSDSSEVH